MPNFVEKAVARAPQPARPQQDIDREALRALINKQFEKTLEYLAR